MKKPDGHFNACSKRSHCLKIDHPQDLLSNGTNYCSVERSSKIQSKLPKPAVAMVSVVAWLAVAWLVEDLRHKDVGIHGEDARMVPTVTMRWPWSTCRCILCLPFVTIIIFTFLAIVVVFGCCSHQWL